MRNEISTLLLPICRAIPINQNRLHRAVAFCVRRFHHRTNPTASQRLHPPSTSIHGVPPASLVDAKACKTPTAASTSPQPAKTSRARRSRHRQTLPLVQRSPPFRRGHETFHKINDESPTSILCSTRRRWSWRLGWWRCRARTVISKLLTVSCSNHCYWKKFIHSNFQLPRNSARVSSTS